jgi:hypothetical protein
MGNVYFFDNIPICDVMHTSGHRYKSFDKQHIPIVSTQFLDNPFFSAISAGSQPVHIETLTHQRALVVVLI